MKYKFIFVILSSSGLNESNGYFNRNDKYMSLKPIQKKHLDLYSDDIKYFFVEFDNNMNKDIEEIGDFIYVKGNELPLVPNMLVKTLKSIEYIKNKYDYDYIIHTNITSLWNIKVLLSLYNTIPRNNFFGGHYIFGHFITGTGIIISNDLIPLLLSTNISNNKEEDVVISEHMKNSVPVYKLNDHSQFKLNYQILDETCNDTSSPHHKHHNKIPESMDDILYFRISSASNEYDLYVTKLLINKLSNIEII